MRKYFTLCLLLTLMVVASNGVCATSDNLVINGDFEEFSGPAPTEWTVFKSLPGWSSGKAGIEIQPSRTVVPAYSGSYYVELDTDPRSGTSSTNSTMTQSLSLVNPGAYQLSFWYMPREKEKNANGDDNGISYSVWNDNYSEAGSISLFRTGNSVWSEVTMDFIIGANDGTDFNLTFKAIGKENTRGGLIDNVSVRAIATPIPSSMALLLSGVVGFAVLRRKKAMK